MKKKLFIAFEGIDGSGKSTQAKILSDKLNSLNFKASLTVEPTYNNIGKIIREILTHKQKAHPQVVAGLFVADRLDHILNEDYGMQKLLLQGNIVITDRYYLSSFAYNGLANDMDWVINANAKAIEILKPDIHFFIDIPVEIALERINTNRDVVDLYETKENLQIVREKYLLAIEKCKQTENIVIINGLQSIENIQAEIWQYLEKL